jgi:hypothetical protein
MTHLIDPYKRYLAPRGLATPREAEAGASLPAKVIANTSTPVPQGQGNFDFMTYPQASAGTVAFSGAGKGQPSNLYQTVGGQLRLALAVGTPIPSTGGFFTEFGMPVPAQSALAFIGLGSHRTSGIYVKSGEVLTRIADTSTPVPGGAGSFSQFAALDFDPSGAITFVAADAMGALGVYLASFPQQQPIRMLANAQTPIPGGGGNFDYFSDPSVAAGSVAFFASRTGHPPAGVGIYVSSGGALRPAATTKTPVPGAAGTFYGFGSPSISGGTVVFHAIGTAGSDGIYAQTGTGPVSVVADLNTPVPGAAGTFQAFFNDDPSIDGDTVAFCAGYSQTQYGLFARVKGKIVRVVTTEDTINGQAVIFTGLTTNQLGGGVLAFYVVTGPGIFGNYTLPVG